MNSSPNRAEKLRAPARRGAEDRTAFSAEAAKPARTSRAASNRERQLKLPGIEGALPRGRSHARPEQQLRVALWLAYYYSCEAMDLEYAWPPLDNLDEAAEFNSASRAMMRLAETIAAQAGLDLDWRAAVENFGDPNAPGAP
jgi:hypothetical protein